MEHGNGLEESPDFLTGVKGGIQVAQIVIHTGFANRGVAG